jgi:hypothetical protein
VPRRARHPSEREAGLGSLPEGRSSARHITTGHVKRAPGRTVSKAGGCRSTSRASLLLSAPRRSLLRRPKRPVGPHFLAAGPASPRGPHCSPDPVGRPARPPATRWVRRDKPRQRRLRTRQRLAGPPSAKRRPTLLAAQRSDQTRSGGPSDVFRRSRGHRRRRQVPQLPGRPAGGAEHPRGSIRPCRT